MPNQDEGLSNSMTVVALTNGMIGGIILVMPILALKSGYLMIMPVVIVCGFFSYYSCLLCIKHLRNYKDLDQAVLKHFDNKRSYKIFYDVCIAVSLIVLLILYFDLICKQWEGITTQSNLIPILNAIVLFPAVYIMKKFHFGASLLAYGIISTIGYCFFILYMWINAPTGPKQLITIDKHFPQLAAALGQGFSIQAFFIPILKKNQNRYLYKRLLKVTYIIGGLAYTFIGYGGALSILNKTYPGPNKPETITQYFGSDEWQVVLVQIIYLIHLYSAFPEFLLISKKRIFSFLEWPQQSDVTFKEVIYVGLVILICLIIKLTSLSAETLIELNGSVIAFIFIVVIPVGLHVKCLYFTERHHKYQDEIEVEKEKNGQLEQNLQSSNPMNKQKGVQAYKNGQIQQIEMQIEMKTNVSQKNQQKQKQTEDVNQNNVSDPKPFSLQNLVSGLRPNTQSQNSIQSQSEDKCDIQFKTRAHKYCDMLIVTGMVLSGLATMGYTIYLIILDHIQDDSISTL